MPAAAVSVPTTDVETREAHGGASTLQGIRPSDQTPSHRRTHIGVLDRTRDRSCSSGNSTVLRIKICLTGRAYPRSPYRDSGQSIGVCELCDCRVLFYRQSPNLSRLDRRLEEDLDWYCT